MAVVEEVVFILHQVMAQVALEAAVVEMFAL
jgi:hypothetical protein